MFEVAEKAVKCFETWSGTQITLHAYSPQWSALLPVQYSIHRHPACREVKLQTGDRPCMECDMIRLRQAVSDYPNGGIKVCPAGMLEWFLPLFDEQGIQALLFAGMRKMPANGTLSLPRFESKSDFYQRPPDKVPCITAGEELLIMEGLNQLAARLAQLFVQNESEKTALSRQAQIMQIIRKHYRNPELPAILCSELSLSESRMRHVVTLETGSSLQDLVINIRLYRIQMELLHNDRPIAEIAWDHGFSNMAHFYRTFKMHFKVSPRTFRNKRGIID